MCFWPLQASSSIWTLAFLTLHINTWLKCLFTVCFTCYSGDATSKCLLGWSHKTYSTSTKMQVFWSVVWWAKFTLDKAVKCCWSTIEPVPCCHCSFYIWANGLFLYCHELETTEEKIKRRCQSHFVVCVPRTCVWYWLSLGSLNFS